MSDKKIRVLIFPAGDSASIELHDALSTCVNVEVFGAASVDRHGEYVFRNYISGLPMISKVNFIDAFNQLISEKQIDLIFPVHDTIVEFLVQHQKELAARVIAGDKRTTEICRSKILTYELFADCDFIPAVYSSKDAVDVFPVCVKPDKGQGGQGFQIIPNVQELAKILDSSLMILEYLPGIEYTVDCFTDKDGALRYVSPRSRQRIWGGICVRGQSEPLTGEITSIAERINQRLAFKGLWFFQVKELMEISSRCAGTMELTRAKGINLPLLSVYTAMGYDSVVFDNGCHVQMDRALLGRYKIDYDYDTVYMDFDDTIIINNQVNYNAIRFLYQCRNQQKKVYLITRHESDFQETLKKYAISEYLFQNIFHLKDNGKKKDVIQPSKAIFIDNAFQERLKIKEAFNIPVFDVDAIEFLLDWRS